MTKQRSLKRLVRERMARTGESYTTAYRVITSRRPDRRTAGLLPSYPVAGYAVHRESALVQRLLASTGLELSEDMVCGLGGGVGFMYAVFEYKALPHPLLTFVAQHHPRPWVEEVAENLGAELSSVTSSSVSAALGKLAATLGAGRPALVTVGKGRLPWVPEISEVEAAEPYTLVVAGQAGDDFIVDDCSETPHRVPAEVLGSAWAANKKGRFAIQTLDVPPLEPADLRVAVRAAVSTTIAHMTGPVLGNAFDVNFGLSGIDKWATEVVDGRTKKGWPARFGSGEAFEHAMSRVAECFTHAYSAPGATRPIYARFLREAGDGTSLALDEAAAVADESGLLWQEVVEVAAVATEPGTALATIGALASELHGVETRLMERLTEAVGA